MNLLSTTWKQNVTYLAVIYATLEQGKRFSTFLQGDDVWLGPVFDDMHRKGLMAPEQGQWTITQAGKDLRTHMVAMYDQLLKFEIFANVNQTLQLTEEQSPDGTAPYDNLLDPRFAPSPASEDLRLAMLDWYNASAEDQLGGKKVDPYQVVFMQKLRAGKYSTNFWFNLVSGVVFQEIEQIVNSAVKWTDMASDSAGASDAMNAIYSAGMSEQIKRDGERCTCGAYLGMYNYYAQKDGKTLDTCPSCNGSFLPPAPSGELCPNCNSDIRPRQRKCHGCGAKIDRSLAAGTIQDVTTVTETWETTYYDAWGSSYMSYGYYPPAPLYYGAYYGVYYDPYEPIAAVAAFALICAVL